MVKGTPSHSQNPPSHSSAPAGPTPPPQGVSRAAVMMVVTAGLASMLEIIDTSIVNVAIPTMMGNLGATLDEIGWVVTGYIISNAIVLPISGWLGVRIGRRKYYISCILLFVASSVACGLAPNLHTLIAFRVLQGLAGGALLPTSQALIQEAFPGRSGLGSALYGMVVIIGPTLGPPLGGFLTDQFGWRMIFNINLPLGLLAAFMATMYVTDYKVEKHHEEHHNRMRSAPVDFIGLGLLVAGVGCLQFVLERGEADDWFSSQTIIILSVITAICVPAFLWWELKVEHPIVNLRLFKNLALFNGAFLMASVGGMLYALIFFIPIFAQFMLSMNASQTGNLFMPSAILSGLMMPVIGMQMQKRDPRMFIFYGLSCSEIALFMIAHFSAQSTYWNLFWPLMIRGAGMSSLFVPINAVVLGQFTGPNLGQAAGIMNLSRQIGGSVGIAVFATMFKQSQDRVYHNLVQFISPLNMNFSQWAYGAKALGYHLSNEVGFFNANSLLAKEAYFRVQKQAFVVSFDVMMWVMLLAFSLTLIPTFFLHRPARLAKATDAH